MTLDRALILLLVVFLASNFAQIALALLFRRRLQVSHPEIWTALGEPTFYNSSLKSEREFGRYRRSKTYLALGDTRLNRLATALKWTRIFVNSVLAAYILLFWYVSQGHR